MVGVLLEIVGDELFQPAFDFVDILSRRQSGAIGDAKDVRVHGNRRLAEGCIQDHIGRLAPDTGKGLQCRACVRNLAAVFADEDLRQRDDVLRLVAEQTDGADVRDQSVDAEFDDGCGRVCDRKEPRGRLVDL